MHSVDAITKNNFGSFLEVQGGCKLVGEIKISGAKNSALVLMAAALLTEEKIAIRNVPSLTDIDVMSNLLISAGVSINRTSNEIELCAKSLKTTELPYELVHPLRASFVCIGPLLSRFGSAQIPLPGGCQIGARPVDEHIKGLEALGAEVIIDNGVVKAKIAGNKKKLKGCKVTLNCKSVGATETILMAATLAEGQTIIENCAQEPEIQDLAHLLNSMGATIKGIGSSTITIEGANKLKGSKHTVIPDRIEAGTFLIAAAITRSELSIFPVIPNHLKALLEKLDECGCAIEIKDKSIKITPNKLIKSVDITTKPYPGFPTDLQAPFMALMATAKGTSKIIEKVFENRMQHVEELKRMGSSIQVHGNTAVVKGTTHLNGSSVFAGDLRASAAMILASLSAKGESIIQGLEHLDRGYENIEGKLNQAGCNIVRKQPKLSITEQIPQGLGAMTSHKQKVA